MAKRLRRNHSSAFNANVSFTAIKGNKAFVELSKYFNVDANQITQWKNKMLKRSEDTLDGTGH